MLDGTIRQEWGLWYCRTTNMRELPYKSHGVVGISIREEECIGVVTTAKGNNKEDSGRTGKYYAEGGK